MTFHCEVLLKVAAQSPHYGHLDYLEIGVRDGASMQTLLERGALRLGVGVDTWRGEYGGTNHLTPDYVAGQLERFMEKVILLTGDSKVVVGGMRHHFDLILIDGDHSLEGCIGDLNACKSRLKIGGTIIVDDIDHPAHTYLHKAVKDWAAAHNLRFQHHNPSVAQLSHENDLHSNE